jgi:predicted dehydrogenase
MIKKNIWLIGCGQMSIEYFKVLKKLKCNFKVIGRGFKSAKEFEKKTNHKVYVGGVNYNLKKFDTPKVAIIAVSVDQLYVVSKKLIKAGVKKILVEKPGALNFKELEKLSSVKKTKIFIAYNRRFYESVIQAKKIIDRDGGLKSINFDFTEWSSKINKLNLNSKIKKKWVISNSSHVIDLAFFLSGRPKEWSYWSKGKLDWHSSARFCGAGISDKGVIFSYLSDWSSPGRWGIDLMTLNHRLILRPMEKLQIVDLKTLRPRFYIPKNKLDLKFKPGLFLQTKSFLKGNYKQLCSLENQIKNFKLYYKIAGYKINE